MTKKTSQRVRNASLSTRLRAGLLTPGGTPRMTPQRGASLSSARTACGGERHIEIYMRIGTLLAFFWTVSIGVQPLTSAADQTTGDVLIQAGHEGRPDCNLEPKSLCENTGASQPPGEIAWTPIVADEATKVLTAHGVSVIRKKAYLKDHYTVEAAVFIHFDASPSPAKACGAHSSVGYPNNTESRTLAVGWKELYGKYWPYGFHSDNYTTNLSDYYGYHHVTASHGEFLVEGGEMSCPTDYVWLKDHLKFIGDLLAYYLSRQIGKGGVPLPRP